MRFRRDTSVEQGDGSVLWYAQWVGGPSLAAVQRCRVHGTEKRYTVEITGYPDTWFSQPAVTRIKGRRITGYVTSDDEGYLYFRPNTPLP